MAEKIMATPAETRRLVLTREAAKVLGCTMGHARHLAREKKVKSWILGPRSIAFDLVELQEYAKKNAAEGKNGATRKGSFPKGFSPDT